jgi:hypothetical protein
MKRAALDLATIAAARHHPAFAPLWTNVGPAADAWLAGDHWPTVQSLNQAWRHPQYRFVDGEGVSGMGGLHYEERISLTGQIVTRANAHDFFNALVWMAWPRAKAALSARHAQVLAEGGTGERVQRGSLRDALTLFDEGGVVVMTTSPQLAEALREHRWHDAFWRLRETWATTRVAVFGHALCEQLCVPYLGLTARAWIWEVPATASWLGAEWVVVRPHLDGRLSELLGAANLRPRAPFTPLPILGVPGWDVRNAMAEFYDNKDYFRPKVRLP